MSTYAAILVPIGKALFGTVMCAVHIFRLFVCLENIIQMN